MNKPENVLYSGVSSLFIPNLVRYHCPTVLYLIHRKIVRKTFQRQIRLYDKGDYVTFRNKLNSIDWDRILATDYVNKCAEQFSDSIISSNYICEQSTVDDRVTTLPDIELPDYALLNEIYIIDDDVREAIILLNSNKSPSPDLLIPRLLKEGMQQLVIPLRLKKFPDPWKKSNLTTIHKKDSLTHPGNYRPISLLNCNGKIM